MHFIGITGGVGAGKSAILDFLATLPDSKIMLADQIAHDLMEPGTACYKQLYEIYGPKGMNPADIYAPDGTFDRRKTAQVIFSDEKQREIFNGIVHPAVKEYIREIAAEERQKGTTKLLVFEAALLIEEHYDEICDELWYIYTSEENRRARLKASRGYSDAKIDHIFASQLSEQEFEAKCREKIDNNRTIEETKSQLVKLLLARGIECAL